MQRQEDLGSSLLIAAHNLAIAFRDIGVDPSRVEIVLRARDFEMAFDRAVFETEVANNELPDLPGDDPVVHGALLTIDGMSLRPFLD